MSMADRTIVARTGIRALATVACVAVVIVVSGQHAPAPVASAPAVVPVSASAGTNELARELNAGVWRRPSKRDRSHRWDRIDSGTMRVTSECAVSSIPRHTMAVCPWGTATS
jgi:hypothetical protein